jgi:hypothetical protein
MMKIMMNRPKQFFLIAFLLLTGISNLFSQSGGLSTFIPPDGYVLDWQTDWKTLESGLTGNNALPDPWYAETGENRVSDYEASNVFTTNTTWGTALVLRASATGNSDNDRYGGKIRTPKMYVEPPFVIAVWATINPVHGKKNSLWTVGSEVSGTPNDERGFLEIDMTEIGYAQRGERTDGNSAYDIPPGHGWCNPHVHLWEVTSSSQKDKVSSGTKPADNPDAAHTVEALKQPLLFVTQVTETDVKIWQDGNLVCSMKSSDLSGSSDNTGEPWKEIFNRALQGSQQIIFSSEAIKSGKTWSAEYGNTYYGTGPFDHNLFPSSTYIHQVKVYRKSDLPPHGFCTAHSPPTIDGIKDESWNYPEYHTLENEILGSPFLEGDLSASYKARWDDEHLYILVEVKDDSLMNDSSALPWEDDAVEIFIDGNNEKASGYDANDYHFVFRWNDDTVYAYQESALPVNPDGVSFAQEATQQGYIMEMQIAWSALGVTASTAKPIGFDVYVNDDDAGGTLDRTIAWIAADNQSRDDPSSFGSVLLESYICGAARINEDPKDQVVNFDADTHFAVEAENVSTYQWQVNQGASFTDVPDDNPYSAIYTDTLHIVTATQDMSGYQFRCIVSNALGSDTSSLAVLSVVDTVKPTIGSVPDDQILVVDSDCKVSLPDYTAEVEVSDNVDEDLEVSQSPAPGTAISRSTIQVKLTVTDDYNNQTEATIQVEARDTTPPVISSSHQDQFLNAGNNCSAMLPDYTSTIVATDNCNRAAELMIAQTPDKFTTLTDTLNEVILTVTDRQANTSQVVFDAYVRDQTDPTISCPNDKHIPLEQGETTYAVADTTFDPVVVDDNCAVAGLTNDLNNAATLKGAELQPDTTKIVWTAIDQAGNENQCSFTVKISRYTGMESLKAQGIKIYPNPVREVIHYEIAEGSIRQLMVSDLAGKRILKKTNLPDQGMLDVSFMESGIYMLEIKTGKGIRRTQIVKN